MCVLCVCVLACMCVCVCCVCVSRVCVVCVHMLLIQATGAVRIFAEASPLELDEVWLGTSV